MVGGFTPLFVGIPPLPLLTICCFDATRRLVSNKLEFAQFGAHMQKLWQFLFSWKWFLSGPSGSTACPSGSTAWSSQPLYRCFRTVVQPSCSAKTWAVVPARHRPSTGQASVLMRYSGGGGPVGPVVPVPPVSGAVLPLRT